MESTVVVLMFPALFILIFLGIPIAFSLILTSVVAGWFSFGPMIFQQLYGSLYSASTNYILSAIPLFVLMGAILEKSGIAKNLFEAIQLWIGRLPGGLAVTTILMAAIFAAASGVVGAVEIMIGLMAIPAMQKYKYKNSLITGTICAGGSLGTIIPPTVIVVVYSALAQISIGALFAAIMIPGAIMVFLFISYIIIRCILRPSDGPTVTSDTAMDIPFGEKIVITLKSLVPPLLLMYAVLGSLLGGIASPTEAAAVGVAGASILALANKGMTRESLREALKMTVRITSMILLIVAGGTMFTGIFAVNGGADMVESIAGALGGGSTEIIIFFLLVTFFLGFVLDWTSIVLICVPIFTPIIRSLEVDPIWFATLVLITIQTSYLTPPMASSIFYLKSIAPKDITYGQMCWGVIPFIIAQILTLVIVAYFPFIATWLPSKIVGF